jgi:hypothetical protein
MVWGFAANTISTNLARDLGPRMVAAIFFGREAFAFDNGYCWISILVNVPATVFATGYYEFLMRDSLQKIQKGHAVHEDGKAGLARHLTKVGSLGGDEDQQQRRQLERGYANALGEETTTRKEMDSS